MFFKRSFLIDYLFQRENLFWTILLPEWALAICAKKFGKSNKEDVIKQLKKDEEDSLNADNSFMSGL